MATIVAAAGGGDWNTGASWVGGNAPTAADDAQVPLAAGNMSIGAGAVCRSADFSTYTGQLSGTGTLTIGDATAGLSSIALKLVSGMTVTGPPVFSFISTSATVQTVDFASKTTGAVTFNATSNGSWQMTGGHTVGATITVTLTKGTLDVNGQTVSWGLFNSSNSNVRSLTLGAAAITITGASATVWQCGNTSNITSSYASSTITLSGATATFSGGNGKTYGTVNLTGSGVATHADTGTVTFSNLTRTGTASTTDSLVISGNPTVTGTFTCTGNSATNRVLVNSNTVATARTITAAVVTVDKTDFQDITGAGAASWDMSGAVGYTGDCGGNSMKALGIAAFTATATQTATGTSSFTWSTHGWTSRVPLPQDDVVINNAFSATQAITMDMPRMGRSIDFTGVTGSPTFTLSVNTALYGSLTLSSNISGNVAGIFTIVFSGRSSYTITSAGKSYVQILTFNCPNGTYTLNDALSTNNTFTHSNGTFVSSGFNIASLALTGASATRAINITNSTWTITSTTTTTIWDTNFAGLTLTATGSTIIISSATSNTRTFSGGGKTFGALTYTVAGSTGELDITGSNNFSAINFSDVTNARSLKLTAATTNTIGTFNVNGTPGKLMSVVSITGPAFTMTSSSQQSCDYLNLTNSVVDASPKWYAGANSTDNGGNTNWVFTAPPAVAGGSGQNLVLGVG